MLTIDQINNLTDRIIQESHVFEDFVTAESDGYYQEDIRAIVHNWFYEYKEVKQ